MLLRALFELGSVLVLLAVTAMGASSLAWYVLGVRAYHAFEGGTRMLSTLGPQLPAEHPIRIRLQSVPIADLALEEIARLMHGDRTGPAAQALLRLRTRTVWIERFAQCSVHLGILGTVVALISTDPNDLHSFRAQLPRALGTTFWGLVGAIGLSLVAGSCETLLDRASQQIRQTLLQRVEAPES